MATDRVAVEEFVRDLLSVDPDRGERVRNFRREFIKGWSRVVRTIDEGLTLVIAATMDSIRVILREIRPC